MHEVYSFLDLSFWQHCFVFLQLQCRLQRQCRHTSRNLRRVWGGYVQGGVGQRSMHEVYSFLDLFFWQLCFVFLQL